MLSRHDNTESQHSLRGGDELAHCREVFDVIAQLAVEDTAVGYDDDAIE